MLLILIFTAYSKLKKKKSLNLCYSLFEEKNYKILVQRKYYIDPKDNLVAKRGWSSRCSIIVD